MGRLFCFLLIHLIYQTEIKLNKTAGLSRWNHMTPTLCLVLSKLKYRFRPSFVILNFSLSTSFVPWNITRPTYSSLAILLWFSSLKLWSSQNKNWWHRDVNGLLQFQYLSKAHFLNRSIKAKRRQLCFSLIKLSGCELAFKSNSCLELMLQSKH